MILYLVCQSTEAWALCHRKTTLGKVKITASFELWMHQFGLLSTLWTPQLKPCSLAGLSLSPGTSCSYMSRSLSCKAWPNKVWKTEKGVCNNHVPELVTSKHYHGLKVVSLIVFPTSHTRIERLCLDKQFPTWICARISPKLERGQDDIDRPPSELRRLSARGVRAGGSPSGTTKIGGSTASGFGDSADSSIAEGWKRLLQSLQLVDVSDAVCAVCGQDILRAKRRKEQFKNKDVATFCGDWSNLLIPSSRFWHILPYI